MDNVEYAIKKAQKKMSNKYAKNSTEEITQKNNKLKENEVVSFWSNERPQTSREEARYAINALRKNIRERPSILRELEVYREYVPKVLDFTVYFLESAYAATTMLKRYEDVSEENKYKKWTKEEDELLIELACDDISMLQISTSMGRSVSSIKTRITKLVGLKRISQEVAGRFIGTINGNHAECVIDGTIYKVGDEK